MAQQGQEILALGIGRDNTQKFARGNREQRVAFLALETTSQAQRRRTWCSDNSVHLFSLFAGGRALPTVLCLVV